MDYNTFARARKRRRRREGEEPPVVDLVLLDTSNLESFTGTGLNVSFVDPWSHVTRTADGSDQVLKKVFSASGAHDKTLVRVTMQLANINYTFVRLALIKREGSDTVFDTFGQGYYEFPENTMTEESAGGWSIDDYAAEDLGEGAWNITFDISMGESWEDFILWVGPEQSGDRVFNAGEGWWIKDLKVELI